MNLGPRQASSIRHWPVREGKMSTRTKGELDRRRFMQASAAAGAALAAGPLARPALAAAKTIKLGYVSPQTGPPAAFGAADGVTLPAFGQMVKGGLPVGG